MSTPSQIKNVSEKVKREKSKLQSGGRQAKSMADKVNNSWKGDISKAFKVSFDKTAKKMDALYSDFDRLASELNKLSNDVQRAEQEKKAAKSKA